MKVEVDKNSGFCAGVIRAIDMAEEFLDRESTADPTDGSSSGQGGRRPEGRRLFSLGSIVHNESELARLEAKGLVTIDKDDLSEIVHAPGETLLIRAHGEPPETYARAAEVGFGIIDCTCPVVLKLQKDIRSAYERRHADPRGGMILIFGKIGHAEVLGLLGQVGGDALVIESRQMLEDAVRDGRIDLRSPVEIFSQTTKSPAEYAVICARLEEMMATANEFPMAQFKGRQLLTVHNTICSQVAMRYSHLSQFAFDHDIIIFVAGKSSSNGKVLCNLCKSVNIRTYHIASAEDIRREWFARDDSVGVCGATSTPKWLLEDVAKAIRKNMQ